MRPSRLSEDVAAALSGLDITSLETGASEGKIILDDPTPNVADGLPQIGRMVNEIYSTHGPDVTKLKTPTTSSMNKLVNTIDCIRRFKGTTQHHILRGLLMSMQI